jgi:hypothetical protein
MLHSVSLGPQGIVVAQDVVTELPPIHLQHLAHTRILSASAAGLFLASTHLGEAVAEYEHGLLLLTEGLGVVDMIQVALSFQNALQCKPHTAL